MCQVEVSHKSEMAGPFKRGDTIINKHFTFIKFSCSEYKIGCLLLSSKCMQNYTKTYSFLHAHYTEAYKIVEKFAK